MFNNDFVGHIPSFFFTVAKKNIFNSSKQDIFHHILVQLIFDRYVWKNCPKRKGKIYFSGDMWTRDLPREKLRIIQLCHGS